MSPRGWERIIERWRIRAEAAEAKLADREKRVRQARKELLSGPEYMPSALTIAKVRTVILNLRRPLPRGKRK